MRNHRIAASAATVAALAAATTLHAATTTPRPNIILIVADDLGRQDITPYNPDCFYETPNLARFATQAVRFTNGYAANPVCSPTRASIQTGRYPTRAGITYWIGGGKPGKSFEYAPASIADHLTLDTETLAEGLKKAGYQTAFAGKWHLGEDDKYQPAARGYDTAIASRLPKPLSYFVPYHNIALPDGPHGEYLSDRLAAESIKRLDQMAADKTKPFYLCHCFFLVHEPLGAPDDLIAKYKAKAAALGRGNDADYGTEEQNYPIDEPRQIRVRQSNPTYAGMVEKMDEAFGKLMAEVDRLGIADNTIIIFLGDNGGLATAGGGTSNLPLRGGKGWLYEGGIREPFLIRWPAAIKPAANDTPMMSIDILPTLYAAANAPLPAGEKIDGLNLLPMLTAPDPAKAAPARDALFWDFPHYGTQGGFPGGAIRMGDWKLLERYTDGRVQLYNLKTDLSEQHDLAADPAQSARVAEMRARLHAWYKDVGAKFLQKTKNGPEPWRPDTPAANAATLMTTPTTNYAYIPGLTRPNDGVGWDD